MEMLSGSQIDSFLSATSLVWASSIVLIMIGLVYFIKYKESHDSIKNTQFFVLYLLTIILNILEYVMNIIMQRNPSYETIIYKSYILAGFFWDITIIFYVVNYLFPNKERKISIESIIKLIFIIIAIVCCLFLDVGVTLENNGKFYVLTGTLYDVFNLIAVAVCVMFVAISIWYRKVLPKSFALLSLLTFIIFISIMLFKNYTGYIVKETVFVCTLLVLVIFNTTSNQDKELVNKLKMSKDSLTNINNRRNKLINKVSHHLGESLNDIVLYNDELYITKEKNKEIIQKNSIEIKNTGLELTDYISNVKDISLIESNINLTNALYQLNMLINDIDSKILPLAKSNRVNFKTTVDEKCLLNYIGDNKIIEKTIVNILYNTINSAKEGQSINLNIESKKYEKNIELGFSIKTNATVKTELPKINVNDFIETDKEINKNDLRMMVSSKLLEKLNSKIDIKSDNDNTVYSFTIMQGFKDNVLYSSIE